MDESRFIAQCKERLHDILKKLKWTQEVVLKTFNTNSEAVPDEEHIEEYFEEKKEPVFPENCAQKNSIVLEQKDLQVLLNDASISVPIKFSDLQVGFSTEQKLKLYEFVIDKTEKFTEPKKSIPSLNNSQQSLSEILALKKLEKKKRRKYRTTKPTYIEEVRGLVELQMQALEQFLGRQYPDETKNRPDHHQCQPKDTEKVNHSKQTDDHRNKIEMRFSRKRRRSHSSSRRNHRHGSHSRSCDYRSQVYREPSSHGQQKRSRSQHRGHREKHKKHSRSRSKHLKKRSRNSSNECRTPKHQSHNKSRSRSRKRKHRSRSTKRRYE